jgi:hypothetical protein
MYYGGLMILIAHRGNIHGPKPEYENMPYHIEEAIHFGYDVEVDVWSDGTWFWLGHDKPETFIDLDFLDKYTDRLWCHAKSPQTLITLLVAKLHCFYNVDDNVTLTSKNVIWTHPNCAILTRNSICVLPERGRKSFGKAYGICSDYVGDFKEFLK